ncbi:hypothetical protein BM528_03140 [Alteromonas sp. RW2A1]|nr:hypothetical protein BM528_03140 [Alteromonas sp. RW2A1]
MSSSINMSSSQYYQRVCHLIEGDAFRMECLQALEQLALPQGYIGAGFLRNAIWDDLHGKKTSTPLNDVDVIYFDAHVLNTSFVSNISHTLNPSDSVNREREQDLAFQEQLNALLPGVNWQVKNQARMHVLHDHAPYKDCEDAISYWIERETCVAIALSTVNQFDILAPFGLAHNFKGQISINPKLPRYEIFNKRVTDKKWCDIWPQLKVVAPQA